MVNSNVNILNKLYNRQLSGRVTGRCGLRERELSLCEPRQPWYYVPLKNIIDAHKALLKGHVLLGFLKDGIHLISYLCQVESSEVDILHSVYTYSLYIWRFDLGTPLKKVCSYPLFDGEMINSDLQLIICETAESDRLVVLGAAVRTEETSRQCYVSIFPSPELIVSARSDLLKDLFFVHFKYDVQPPYPPFSPLLSLKLKDSLICNTGDSLTILTITRHNNLPEYCPPSPTSTTSHSSEGESDVSDQLLPRKKAKHACSCPSLRSAEHLSTCVVGRMETVHVATECDVFSPIIQQKRRRVSSRRITSQSPKILGDKKKTQVEAVTTFSCRMYGLSQQQPTNEGATRYDATQTLYPVRVSSLAHGTLRLTHTQTSEFPAAFKPPLPDDYITVKQVSFDAELYINNAVPLHEELSARYLSLRDYDMRLLDVCQGTNNVILLIMVLCLGQQEAQKHRQVLVSTGFILSWNVSTGAATTLDFLPVEEFAANPCSAKRWCPGAEKALELRKQWFVPTAYHRSVRAFSNASVFSGVSLKKLQHPYLPVAIIL